MIRKISTLATACTALLFAACGNNSGTTENKPVSFCKDSACMAAPMRVAANNAYVNISFKDCKMDSIIWEKNGAGKKTINFSEFIPNDIRPTKQAMAIDIVNDKYAWVRFNDCATARGYAIKLPFDKNGTAGKYTSAINGFDPDYKVADGLVAYYDNTFIYVQDMATAQVAKVLITDTGVPNTDFSDVHSLIKSASITKQQITATINYEGKASEINKPLEFKEPAK